MADIDWAKYNPYSGPFDVSLDQLSPKLREATKQPEWELHYTFTERLVNKANDLFKWYWFPTIEHMVLDDKRDHFVRNEAGFIEVTSTQDRIMVARLPLSVRWEYIGITTYWGSWQLFLSFYPSLVFADGQCRQSAKEDNLVRRYFEGFEAALIDLLERHIYYSLAVRRSSECQM